MTRGTSQVDALVARGYRVVDAGDFEGALLIFRRARELDASRADLRELCAQCLMQMDKWEDAYKEAQQAHEMNPSWLDGAITLGRVARNTGRLQEALVAFRRAFLASPSDPEVLEQLEEVQELWQKSIGRRVGMTELCIAEEWPADKPPGDAQLGCTTCCPRMDSSAGPGGVVWDCGIALGKCLRDCWPAGLAGKRVLELGTGTGIAGIVAACCGADVTLTDLPEQLKLLEDNVSRNNTLIASSGGSASCRALDWGSADGLAGFLPQESPGATADGSAAEWDIILGADLLYSQQAIAPLVKILKQLLQSSPKALFILAHKARSPELDDAMHSAMEGAGVQLHNCPWPAGLELSWDDRVLLLSSTVNFALVPPPQPKCFITTADDASEEQAEDQHSP